VVDGARAGGAGFYRRGALLMGGAGLPGGCATWSRV
jgi:hypothetical protein